MRRFSSVRHPVVFTMGSASAAAAAKGIGGDPTPISERFIIETTRGASESEGSIAFFFRGRNPDVYVFIGRDCGVTGWDGTEDTRRRSDEGAKSSSLVRHVNPWCDRYSGNDVRRGCARRDWDMNDGGRARDGGWVAQGGLAFRQRGDDVFL